MALVTICVLTYNPDWIKFRNTLRSIICQRNVDFDIVVSDDGSEENYFDKAEEFLKETIFLTIVLLRINKIKGRLRIRFLRYKMLKASM